MIAQNILPPPKSVGTPFRPRVEPVRSYTVASQAMPQVQSYTVQSGTTLAGLAQLFYSNPRMWTRIFNANRLGARRPDGTPGVIANPNSLPVGTVLLIP